MVTNTADDEENFEATTEFFTAKEREQAEKEAEETMPADAPIEKDMAEKKRKKSIFARLKALMGDKDEKEDEDESYHVVDDSLANTDMIDVKISEEENFEEGATEEFSIGAPSYEEETLTPEEEMLENYVEDSGEIDNYSFVNKEETPKEEEEIHNEETERNFEEELPADAEITDAFEEGEAGDGEEEIFEESEESEETEENTEEPVSDYVSFEQNGDIFDAYKRKYSSVSIRMGISAAIAVLLLLIENIGIFGLKLPEFMTNPAVMVPVEWAMVFALAVLAYDSIIGAAKKLVKFEFEPATVTLIAFVFSFCATFSALFAQGSFKLFNFAFAICVFFNLLSVYICLRKEIFAFKIVSSAKKKYILSPMSAEEAEPEARDFAEYLSEQSDFYRVETAEFLEGYFTKKKQAPASYKKLRVMIPIMFAAAVVLAIFSATVKSADAYTSITSGYLAFVMCAPIAVFFVNELPMYLSAIKAYSGNSAILGDSALEMMENMSVISFDDSDVFKNDGVKIKGVKIIDENNIEHIIHYAASVFNIVGGPLAKVFKQAALDSAETGNAEVRVISSQGIDATVDGKHIVIGVQQYMDAQCFKAVRESGDEQWEGKTNKRILYLACDEEVIAKFYVEYTVNPEFAYIVKKLSDAGICVGVRTNDPCVDVDVFYKSKISPEQYPITVVKGEGSFAGKESVSAKEAGVVSAGTAKNLVKTLVLCDRLSSVIGTNFVINAVAAFIGLAIIAFLVIVGTTFAGIWSVYFALYQLLWILPVYLISKIYI